MAVGGAGLVDARVGVGRRLRFGFRLPLGLGLGLGLGRHRGAGVSASVVVDETGTARPARRVDVQPGVEEVGDLAGPGTAWFQPVDAASNALDAADVRLVAGRIGE